MGKLLLAFALIIVSFGEAAAQDMPSVKAHLECKAGGKKLKNKKKLALAGDIECKIPIDGGTVADVSTGAMIQITQKGGLTASRWGTVQQADGKVWIAFDAPFARMTDFLPCKDVTIEGAVGLYGSDINASLWHGKMSVKAKCKKPKKMKATLKCMQIKGGTYTCGVTGKKAVKAAEGIVTMTTAKGSTWGEMAVTADMIPFGSVELDPMLYLSKCGDNTVTAVVTNALGQTVWTGKQDLGPACAK